jgi:hypothetical protein
MRILFVLRHQHYIRLFESTIDELGARGHQVHVVIEQDNRHWTRDQTHDMIDRLCTRHAGITRGMAAARDDVWRVLLYGIRESIDYLRYLEPPYAHAAALRARVASEAPALVVGATRWPLVRTRPGIFLLSRLLRYLERTVPDSAAVGEFLRTQEPDLLMLTPLVAEPSQADYVRSARSLGLRSALCVASWDNLTNKGLIHELPDRVYLWNDEQRREAVELHGVPTERVVTTGAQCFDQWFSWRPSSTAEQFRTELGLPPDRAMLLYVCSSTFVAPQEPEFVERWLRALRSHPDPRLSQAGVLIRPHPKSGAEWRESALRELSGVAVWPPAGTMRTDEEARSTYFDSIHHSQAVVGINTSALIESAIVGRRVFTVLDPQFKHSQEGTLHFQYLLRANGGPLTVAESFDAHFEQLSEALADGGETGEIERRFVARFVRPHGLERRALPVLVDALEEQIAAPAPQPAPADTGAARRAAVLRPMAQASGWWERHIAKRGPRRTVIRWGRRRLRRLLRALRRLPVQLLIALVALLKRLVSPSTGAPRPARAPAPSPMDHSGETVLGGRGSGPIHRPATPQSGHRRDEAEQIWPDPEPSGTP